MKLHFLFTCYLFAALTSVTCMVAADDSGIAKAINPPSEKSPEAATDTVPLDCTAVAEIITGNDRRAGRWCTKCMCNGGNRMPMFLCVKGRYPAECKNELPGHQVPDNKVLRHITTLVN